LEETFGLFFDSHLGVKLVNRVVLSSSYDRIILESKVEKRPMKQRRLKGVVNIIEGSSDNSFVWNPGSSDLKKYRNEAFVSDAVPYNLQY
jgi:hypothetical protein